MPDVFEQASIREIEASKRYTPHEKERRIREQQAISTKMNARFRQRVLTEIDFRKVIEDMMLPLYDKFFTEAELADLIAFYKTPTGEKTLTIMPELFGQAFRRSTEIIGTKVPRSAERSARRFLKSSEMSRAAPSAELPTAPRRPCQS